MSEASPTPCTHNYDSRVPLKVRVQSLHGEYHRIKDQVACKYCSMQQLSYFLAEGIVLGGTLMLVFRAYYMH